MLRPFVLAAGNETRRQVRDAHGGVGRVHMLTPFAPRPVRVDAQIFDLDVDHNRIVNLGRNEHTRETCMPALGLIERRNAHQPMHPRFTGEQPKRKVTRDRKGRRLDARFVAVLDLVHLGLEALPLRPAQVHAHQHLGPVLGFGPTRARVHGHDGIERIVLLRQHRA